MNMLPCAVIDRIACRDRELHTGPNRTRFYSWLLPDGPDMEVHTVAVKARRDGSLCVKEVVRASVDDLDMRLLDLVFLPVAGYIVDWHPEGLCRQESRYGSYHGKWGSELYRSTSGLWKINCPVLNPVVLTEHERFRWCAWSPNECGHVLDYLKAYAQHPRIEMLTKVGLGRLATKTGFVAQMERDKGLLRFVMANMDAIRTRRIGCNAIRIAYRDRIDLGEAGRRLQCRRLFLGMGLPVSIDPARAQAYCEIMHKCGRQDYCLYLRNCERLGLDLADTRVSFPRQFRRRERIVSDQIAELDRKANAEAAKKMDDDLAKVAAKFVQLERGRGSLRLVLPRRSSDFRQEGKTLGHCIGDGHYAAKMARGETLIAFCRQADRPRTPFVSVEFDLGRGRILQAYGAKNSRPPAPVLRFIERRCSALRTAK